jgi:hypothetical protein
MIVGRYRYVAIVATVVASTVASYSPTSHADSAHQGSVGIELSNDVIVPGQRLDVSYQTSPGTLQDQRVDIYFSLSPPDGPLVFLQRGRGFSDTPAPLRSNVKIREATRRLFRFYPVRQTFGTYTYSIVLLYTGKSFGDEDAYASEPASSSFTFAPLSESQQALVNERGNPDVLTTAWIGELKQKQDLWFYYSEEPTRYDFTNGDSVGESPLAGSAGGTPPQIDPSLLTPQTTLDELTAIFGTPSDVTRFVDGAPGYQGATFSVGLDVIFRNGRLTFAKTYVP